MRARFVCSFVGSFVRSFVRWFVRSLVRSFVGSFVGWLMRFVARRDESSSAKKTIASYWFLVRFFPRIDD